MLEPPSVSFSLLVYYVSFLISLSLTSSSPPNLVASYGREGENDLYSGSKQTQKQHLPNTVSLSPSLFCSLCTFLLKRKRQDEMKQGRGMGCLARQGRHGGSGHEKAEGRREGEEGRSRRKYLIKRHGVT